MGREVHGASGNGARAVGFRAREMSATVFMDGPPEADRKVTRVAPVCSNCGASDFVWANELKTGGIGGGSLSLRSRGELALGTRICPVLRSRRPLPEGPFRPPHAAHLETGGVRPHHSEAAAAPAHHSDHSLTASPPAPAPAPAPAATPSRPAAASASPSWLPSAAPSHHVALGSPSVTHAAPTASLPPASPPPPAPPSAPPAPSAPAPPPPRPARSPAPGNAAPSAAPARDGRRLPPNRARGPRAGKGPRERPATVQCSGAPSRCAREPRTDRSPFLGLDLRVGLGSRRSIPITCR